MKVQIESAMLRGLPHVCVLQRVASVHSNGEEYQLKDVMSNPRDDLVPAKRKLIDFNLSKAGQITRDILTDLLARTIAEIVKP